MPNFSAKIRKNDISGKILVFFACFAHFLTLNGQKNDLPEQFDIPTEHLLLIEDYLESLDNDASFDLTEILDDLNDAFQNKLDLNQLRIEDLYKLHLLSDIQINNFEIYRTNFGPFISLYELQAIPGFDIQTVKRIIPFVLLRGDQGSLSRNIADRIKSADHELIIRSQRILEDLKGSRDDNGFLGDPYRHFLRYRLNQRQNLKIGFQAEKDVGEEFFKGSNGRGFDFYSFYFSVRDVNNKIKSVHLGDFTVSMGQGLIVHNQFGAGLTSFTTNIKKGNRTFSTYTSRNEVDFFRGGAIEYSLDQDVTVGLFASRNAIDGTLRDRDDDDVFESFSSINNSGNHRTNLEVAKKNQIKRNSIGGTLEYSKKHAQVSINVLTEHFDKTFSKTQRPDNIFFPEQATFFNASVDYSYRLKNLNLFGESAYGNSGGTAHLLGALIGLDRKLDLSLLYRNYSPRYFAIDPNSFGQGSTGNNEKGIYLGMELRPVKNLFINAYADYWANPWLRFRVDSPGKGNEYLVKISYLKKRKFTSYILFKTESKPRNSQIESAIDFTIPQRTSRLRLQFNNQINATWELRNRLELSFYKNDIEDRRGLVIYQDFLFKPQDFPLSFTTRIMWFDIQDFDARIYAYENDVLSEFSIPFFVGKGLRYYINLRLRHYRYTFELRAAHTRFRDTETIGSGLTEIDGNHQTLVKAQVRIRI